MRVKSKAPHVEQLPSGSFRVRLTLDGQRKSIVSESVSDLLEKYYTALAEGQIAEQHRKKPDSMTLGEAVDAFIASREVSCSPATIRGYQVARRNAHQSLMGRPVCKITDADFQKSINSAAKKQTGKTVKNQWAVIQLALKEVCGRTVTVQLPPVVRNEHEFLTAEQIPIFIDGLKAESIEVQIAALLGLHSLRRSEIVDVTWDDIDLKEKIIHVRGSAVYDGDYTLVHKKTNKSQKSRRDIPFMIPQLEAALLQAKHKSKYVVTIVPGTIQQAVNRVCRKANLPEVGCHGLRHSFASLAFSKKVNLPMSVVQELGGWEDVGTMRKIYTHVSKQDLAEAAQAMSNFFKNP